jgi:hypothetical protein
VQKKREGRRKERYRKRKRIRESKKSQGKTYLYLMLKFNCLRTNLRLID